MYDLRSDTVTKPSDGMRQAMYDAEVGDDVYGEDPTINKLQELAARLTGKYAGIYVPTGSMGNLISIYLLCGKGNEIIAHEKAHILHYEMASLSAVAGAMPVAVPGERGIVQADRIESLIRPDVYHMPNTRLIEVENTHNLAGGTCYTENELAAIRKLADSHGIKVHMDGARVFNASAATGLPVEKICSFADSVSFCLSKGLGAPVGSVLCGDEQFIKEARSVRKMLGGGMRQAGVLAAAGIFALENNVERLVEDHENARVIARALAETGWAKVDPDTIETNIIYFDTVGIKAADVSLKLKKLGILCNPTGPQAIRIVTNLHIGDGEINNIREIILSAKIS